MEKVMKQVRTLGRRVWETRLPIRFAGFVAICMLSVSVWFLWASVQRLQEPHSPHYSDAHCFDCHQGGKDGHEEIRCYTCHDSRSRELLAGADEALKALRPDGGCLHDLKVGNSLLTSTQTVTALCISCHKKVTGYVAMLNIESGKYVEVDMSKSHPIGLMPTATIYPRTLPLSKETGAINCITCHDQHATDKRLRMLRYYYPGNGHPADFRPLCLDCHTDGWLPLKLRPTTVQRAPRRD
jgi:hypothetical protein